MADPLTPPSVEKRTESRIPCSLKALYHPQGRPPLFTRWGTCIHNVSHGGLGLLLPLRLRRGTRLIVELPANEGHDSCTLEVETVRSHSANRTAAGGRMAACRWGLIIPSNC